MLNDISRTPTFERDWKRLRRKHYDSAKLRKAIQTLMAEDADTLIHTYRDHSLKGEWAGFRELHIEGDWLLIYRIDHGGTGGTASHPMRHAIHVGNRP